MHAVVLKYFLEVARSGSIRKAAPSLFAASSAVNRQILEAVGLWVGSAPGRVAATG